MFSTWTMLPKVSRTLPAVMPGAGTASMLNSPAEKSAGSTSAPSASLSTRVLVALSTSQRSTPDEGVAELRMVTVTGAVTGGLCRRWR